MKGEVATALLAIALIAGAGTGYLIGTSSERVSTSVSTTAGTAGTTEHASTASAVLHGDVSLLNVSRTYYWADDVSKNIVIGFPGYSYFLNGSVIFDGVRFETICPPTDRDCPGSNSNSTTVTAGAIRFNMTFPDGTTETTGDVIGDSIFTLILSQHQPRAGMLIEYVNDYGNFSNSVDYAVFLLVSSCGKSPYVC